MTIDVSHLDKTYPGRVPMYAVRDIFGGVLVHTAGSSIARNIEDGTIDLTLACPLSRLRLYLEKWLAMLVGIVLFIAVLVLTAWLCTLLS